MERDAKCADNIREDSGECAEAAVFQPAQVEAERAKVQRGTDGALLEGENGSDVSTAISQYSISTCLFPGVLDNCGALLKCGNNCLELLIHFNSKCSLVLIRNSFQRMCYTSCKLIVWW